MVKFTSIHFCPYSDVVQAVEIENEVVTGEFHYTQPESTIAFFQGWDLVANGTGGLAAMAGGLGRSNLSLILNSGQGERLENVVSVYGSVAQLEV